MTVTVLLRWPQLLLPPLQMRRTEIAVMVMYVIGRLGAVLGWLKLEWALVADPERGNQVANGDLVKRKDRKTLQRIMQTCWDLEHQMATSLPSVAFYPSFFDFETRPEKNE